MPLYRLGDDQPAIAASAFVAAEASLIGKVFVGERASIWFGAVLRGDLEPIRVGEGCNVQDGAVLHTNIGFPLELERNVTVGHQAMLHGCTIGEGTLIGLQAVVMNGAVIGHHSLVGAGAVVTEGKRFPARSLILGAPAKVARELSDEEVAQLEQRAAGYVQNAALYRAHLVRVG